MGNDQLKLLLINPPVLLPVGFKPVLPPPLSLAYLASALSRFDIFEVFLYDCMLDDNFESVSDDFIYWGKKTEAIETYLKETQPDIVAITGVYSAQEEIVVQVCKIVKKVSEELNKKILTIIGGALATALPEQLLSNLEVDFAIIGEGEYSLYQLCRALSNDESIINIKGLGFRDFTDKVIQNTNTDFLDDLDAIPFPAYNLLDVEYYAKRSWYGGDLKKHHFAPIVLSRGCDEKCIHCLVPKIFGKSRLRSPQNIIEEMELLYRRYGIREFHFQTSQFFLNLVWAKSLLKALKSTDMKISWTFHNPVVFGEFDAELVNLMKDTGCYQVWLDMGSGNQSFLTDNLQRPGDLNRFKQLVKSLNSHGIKVNAFFQLGWPGENKEQIRKTIKFAIRLKLNQLIFQPSAPVPGTQLWEICQNKKYLPADFKLSDLIKENALIITKDFNPKEIDWFIEYAKFQLNLRNILSNPIKLISACFRNLLLLIRSPKKFGQDLQKIIRLWKERVKDEVF